MAPDRNDFAGVEIIFNRALEIWTASWLAGPPLN